MHKRFEDGGKHFEDKNVYANETFGFAYTNAFFSTR